MGRMTRPLVLLSALLSPAVAAACIWGWSPTGYVCTPCSPSGGTVPTTTVRRCYYEPRTTYQTVTERVPQLTWTQRCWYDPIFGTYHTLWVPTIAVVEQQRTIPVTTYQQRCETVGPEPAPEAPRPQVEQLPSPSTERRYYYAPNGTQPQTETAPERASEPDVRPETKQPQPVPPPPPPDAAPQQQPKGTPQLQPQDDQKGQTPDANKQSDRRVTVVRVVWRPVRSAPRAPAVAAQR